jgi:hypothetical protein
MKHNERRDDILTALVMFAFVILLILTSCGKEKDPPQPIQSHISASNEPYYNSEYVRTNMRQTWRIYKETHIDTTNTLTPYEYYLPLPYSTLTIDSLTLTYNTTPPEPYTYNNYNIVSTNHNYTVLDMTHEADWMLMYTTTPSTMNGYQVIHLSLTTN